MLKKIFQAIGMISLICVSFMFTEKTVTMVKEADQIMIEIKKRNDELKVEPIDAIIKENTIIPGLSGKEVDIEKSYEKMKRYGDYLESLIEYKTVSPFLSIHKNYDKYIISGNPKKNMVSLVFLLKDEVDVDAFIKKLEKTNTKATFFIDGNWFENHNSKVLELIEKGYEVGNLSYNGNYQDSSFVWMDTIIKKIGKQKQSYCYSEIENEDDILICAMNKDHTIMPSIKVSSYPAKEVKEQVTSGSIISLPMNKEVLEQLSTIIHYVESKGYQIETLENHLSE